MTGPSIVEIRGGLGHETSRVERILGEIKLGSLLKALISISEWIATFIKAHIRIYCV